MIYAPGTPVCFKCGSPTFIVIKDPGNNKKIKLGWFNSVAMSVEVFEVDRVLIESIDDFNERKVQMEKKYNNRLYEIPRGMDPETIITIGFASPEVKQEFLQKMFENDAPGEVIEPDTSNTLN